MSPTISPVSYHNTIRAVLFDLDGLMVDSEPLAEWAWNRVLADYGARLDEETARDILGLRVIDSARLICQRYGLPLSPEQAAARRDRFFLEAVPSRLRPRPGLYPLLNELTARGLPMAVATSGHRRYVRLALATLGVADRFAAVTTGDEVERGKPAPDVFLLAAARLGAPPASCLVLEDSRLGVLAARAAGMVCLAVPNHRTAAQDLSAAHYILPSLEAVRQGLDRLLAR